MSRTIFGGQAGLPADSIEAMFGFVPLPLTEAEADAESFVVEFNGSAGANEVGVGAGLDGANLVLTQCNNPGSDGTNRTIANGTFQGFYATDAFYNHFMQSPLGWSGVYRCKNLNGTSGYVCNLQASNPDTYEAFKFAVFKETGTVAAASTSNGTQGLGAGVIAVKDNALYPKENTPYMFVTSLDFVSGLAFAGMREDDGEFPTKLSDFALFSINPFLSGLGDAPADISYFVNASYPYRCIVGSFANAYASNTSGGQTCVALTMSRKPCYIPL